MTRQKPLILVIDDNTRNIKVLVETLKEQGYSTAIAQNGMLGIQRAELLRPASILLDIVMPEMDGFETCRRLKANEVTKDIPVIFMTALDSLEDKIKGLSAGGVDYITKPFHEIEVLARVRTHVELQRLYQSLQEENARFHALEEATFEGIAMHEQGEILDVNATLARMVGQERNTLVGQPLLNLIAPESKDDAQLWLEESQETLLELTALRHDGAEFPIQAQSRAIHYQGRQISVAVFRDISRQRQLEQENQALKSNGQAQYKFGLLIGKSPVMQTIYEQILTASTSDFGVLISGESGTGKELAARMIHQHSERHEKPFLTVNCGAVHASLFEREFFGHLKGAFTGADRNMPGFFDMAHEGTLFLDEVAELLPEQQVKLLRVLQEGEYTPVGASTPKKVDARIVAATNQDMKALLTEGRIREDFFYRIHIITITMPSLRARKEDLPLLIDHFLDKYGASEGFAGLPHRMMNACYEHRWPGNVRELENEIQRYITTHHFDFLGADVLTEMPEFELDDSLNLPQMIKGVEKRFILRALEQTRQHRGKAALLLGISRRTLYEKIKEFELDEPH